MPSLHAEMNTRPLAVSDLPALHELARTASVEGFQFVERLVEGINHNVIALDSEAGFFLAFVDRTLVVAVGGVTPDPYLSDPATGRLRHLYVIPARRNEGIGRRLVTLLEHRAECAGYARLRLRTDTAAAARFYERLGYSTINHASATHWRALTAGVRRV